MPGPTTALLRRHHELLDEFKQRHCTDTQKYVERRTSEGKSKMEIIRCPKRYVAREAYYLIKQDSTPNRSVRKD
ncbi:hypothetical protein [Streptomyces mirabilis]|uniref:hypothetical protein n=1 Tax=Streptomyces mirabilis TaxID=68239 RepID=UPI0036A3A52F